VTAFEHLGAPLTSGALRLKNRIAHASILTRYAAGERATDRLVAYHENRARGGAAMIVTEAVNALPSQAGRGGYLNAHDDAGLPDLARLATAVTRKP
jgi:2,4-dienoyl-CoA reductase-like NADH-dependent reductase (Old Yellow Enzyme family)